MRKYMLKPDKVDSRDYLYSAKKVSALPEMVDLRPNDAEIIFDQLDLGSCTANAICALMSYLDKNYGSATKQMFFHYSRLYLYWHERNLEGTVGTDSGAYIRDGMKVLQQIGCAAEPLFPYVVNTFTHTPSQKAEDNAKLHKITEYHRLSLSDSSQLKDSLASGYPVVLGIEVWDSFESAEVARTGIVPMPDKSKENLLGGHAILAMGYKHIGNTEYIICRNSWGTDWGDKGYFYLPMSFIGRYISDMWTGK